MRSQILFTLILLISPLSVFANDPDLSRLTADARLSCDLVTAQKALTLKTEVEQANKSDLQSLWNSLIQANGNPPPDWNSLKEGILQKLSQDKTALAQIKSKLDAQSGDDRGTPALRTSLVKIMGTDKNSGILDDAATLLKNADSLAALDPKKNEPKGNSITVLKTLLIYLNQAVLGPSETQKTLKTLRLVYPAPLPLKLGKEGLSESTLCHSDLSTGLLTLMVPNAGYIFGGELSGGVCRGIDCSTFVSVCSDSSVRMSTMVMEYTWRDLMKRPFEEKELPIRAEFLEKWGMKEALTEYQALLPNGNEAPKPGDIVIWRWPTTGGAKSGHAAVFLEGTDGGFLGVEANREDDKSKEGVMVSRFELNKPGAETYILRRRR